MADPVHWLPPWPAGPADRSCPFKAVCGKDLDLSGAGEHSGIPRWSSYTAGQLAIMNGEVTCPACQAALTVRALESSDG